VFARGTPHSGNPRGSGIDRRRDAAAKQTASGLPPFGKMITVVGVEIHQTGCYNAPLGINDWPASVYWAASTSLPSFTAILQTWSIFDRSQSHGRFNQNIRGVVNIESPSFSNMFINNSYSE
jgi:hypothetical protein